MFHLSPIFRVRVSVTSPALKIFRCHTYSAVTFNPATSRFPSHSELQRGPKLSNELIRYMRRWDGELRLDADSDQPRWTPQQRDVMMAACNHFQLVYNPFTNWRGDRLKEALTIWEKGMQVDSQSRQPRWNATLRQEFEKQIALEREELAEEAAARKKKEFEEMQSRLRGCWGKVKLAACLVVELAVLATWALMALMTVVALMAVVHYMSTLWLDPAHYQRESNKRAYLRMALQISPLSAAYSDGVYEAPASACFLPPTPRWIEIL